MLCGSRETCAHDRVWTMAWIIEQITALQLRAVREHKRE